MSSEINLLYSKKQLRRYKLTSQVRLIRFIALGLLFLVTIVSMGFFLLVVSSPLPKLKQQETQITQQLVASQDQIRQNTLMSLRINDIDTIIKKRSQYDQVLSIITKKLPKNSTLIDFSAEKKIVNITVQAGNVSDLEAFMSALSTLVANKTTFSRVYLNSLSLDVGQNSSAEEFKAQIVLVLM